MKTRERAMVPKAEPQSYYGRPVIKRPVWTWEIPAYFFTGGMAGASATLAAGAGALGNRPLARRAWATALAGALASPPLLISDLGRPERFLNMLRVLKPTSPMSVGSWVLSGFGSATGLAAAHALLGRFPRAGRVAKPVAAALGPALSTYTAVLIADTAVPVWHEAGDELPFVFAGSAMASAGAAACALTPVAYAGPARRLTLAGALVELAAVQAMERRLGELAEPYRRGEAAPFGRAAKALTALGTAAIARAGRRHRAAAALGGAGVLAGAFLQRWAVFRAGFESAREPRYTVGPQRRRVAERAAARA
ncbi:MAG: hypothetical protein QOK04_1738 [Solirubrobacteraceae bacterium]|jgi:hypothetical protein|nr:hypothetical protein [Solirubrobacteraceae bacterium]